MTDSVKEKEVAKPETATHEANDKELNFRRLEAEREREREARIRAEMEAKQLKQEVESIKEMLKPKEKDPLDDENIDPDLRQKLQLIRERDRKRYLEDAKKVARQTFEEESTREKRENPVGLLRSEFNDYDKFMNEETIGSLAETHPEFVEAVLKIPDDYERRKATYKFQKKLQSSSKQIPSVQEKVKENMENPYYTPASSGSPSAVEFDLRSREARQAAYNQLKANQKRPVGLKIG